MGETAKGRRLYTIGVALLLSVALLPRITEASIGGGVIPISPAPPAMALVVNSTPLAHRVGVLSRWPTYRPVWMSYRRIIRPHIIIVTAGPAAVRSTPVPARDRNSTALVERFPRAVPRGSIQLVRGSESGFVLVR